MAKSKNTKGMHGGSDKKIRGRTSITRTDPSNSTNPGVPETLRRETTRPVSAGGGKQRGDRRDTSRTYTTTTKHAARGANPRPDVKTRKR